MSYIPKTTELFDIAHSIAEPLLNECEYPHEVLPKIGGFIKEISLTLDASYKEISEGVFVADDAKIWDGTTICAPAIIGHKTEVRPGAFIRGNVIVGDGAVIGNSTELKNSIIFDGAQLPHYNYVGDSIIGYKAHMGAGAIASNLRLDRQEIYIEGNNTGLKKIGVFLGDRAEVGCGCVVCPGTVIGHDAAIYPLLSVKGCIPANSVYNGTTIKEKH